MWISVEQTTDASMVFLKIITLYFTWALLLRRSQRFASSPHFVSFSFSFSSIDLDPMNSTQQNSTASESSKFQEFHSVSSPRSSHPLKHFIISLTDMYYRKGIIFHEYAIV